MLDGGGRSRDLSMKPFNPRATSNVTVRSRRCCPRRLLEEEIRLSAGPIRNPRVVKRTSRLNGI